MRDLAERAQSAGPDETRARGWPKVSVPGQFNMMAFCRQCERHAANGPFTSYVEQAIAEGPYLCDDCLKAQETSDAD